MNNNKVFSVPDEAGWHFFKQNKKTPPLVVYINEDGIGFAMNEEGESFLVEDCVGQWMSIEPEFD